jgi:exodeoxyribonuclease V beta subunit
MQTFDVLDPDISVFSQFFLEASAGTGKTFAIENVIPRLLLESENPCKLEEILVVTFTKAATRELRVRIYKNLLTVAKALEAKEGGPKYLRKIFSQGEEAVFLAKRRIEEALFSFEQAQIFTLHGFCLSVLQEFAFDAKFFSHSFLEKSALSSKEMVEWLKDFFRVEFHTDLLTPSQMKRVCQYKKVGGDIEALCLTLCEVLSGILGKNYSIRPYPTALEQQSKWNALLKKHMRLSKWDLWQELALAFPRMARSKKWKSQIDRFFSCIEKGESSQEEWDSFIRDRGLFLQQLDTFAQKRDEKLLSSNLFGEMKQDFLPLYEESVDPKVLFLTLVSACQAYYEKGKKELSFYSPDDFVLQLKRALLQKSFCDKVRGKFRAAIIDEFQDTDSNQWEIIETLFLRSKESNFALYLVGDPKQSIYGFRSADVYVYLRAKKMFAESCWFCLSTNFRAHPELVEALNALFSFELPRYWMTLPASKESLDVRKVQAKPFSSSVLQGERLGRIHFFMAEEKNGSSKQWPSKELEEELLIPYMASEILRLKRERGIFFHQVAILVKDRFQGQRVQAVFSSWGLSCQIQRSFEEDNIAFDCMKILLDATLQPSRLSCIKKLLGSVLMGYSESEIKGGWENPLLYGMRESLIQKKGLCKKRGFGAFFSQILSMPSKREKQTIEQELLSRKDPSLYFNLRQLCQIILANGAKYLYDPEALLKYIQELQKPESKDLLQRFPEEEEEQVQVMTLHKSKGLEFDIVFALGLSSRHTGKDDFIAVRSKEGREFASVTKEEEAFFAHTDEVDAEKLRQLYVALTRAKERVYIPFILSPCQKVDRGTASPLELFLGGKGLEEYVFTAVYEKISSFSPEDLLPFFSLLQEKFSITHEILKEKPLFSLYLPDAAGKIEDRAFSFLQPLPSFASSFLLSFSSVNKFSEVESSFTRDFLSLESFDIPASSETGIVIHAILEEVCKVDKGKRRDALSPLFFANFCMGSCLEGKESVVQSLIESALKKTIVTAFGSFCLEEIESSDMRAEMEFFYPVHSSFIKGFIDLIIFFEGRYFLLDWKTNALGSKEEDYSQEKILECMQKHQYDLQAAIYSAAIKKMLAVFDPRPFAECFGGAIYFFLRGGDPLYFHPDLTLVDQLDVQEYAWQES